MANGCFIGKKVALFVNHLEYRVFITTSDGVINSELVKKHALVAYRNILSEHDLRDFTWKEVG